jgi:uncharacterized membrane protein YgcG
MKPTGRLIIVVIVVVIVIVVIVVVIVIVVIVVIVVVAIRRRATGVCIHRRWSGSRRRDRHLGLWRRGGSRSCRFGGWSRAFGYLGDGSGCDHRGCYVHGNRGFSREENLARVVEY